MSKYYFDRFDGIECMRDQVGADLSSRETARQAAQELLSEIAQEGIPDGSSREFIVDVRDNLGILIYTCRLSLTGRWLDHSVPPLGNRASSVSN
ncbi:DUF6894 family protein [Roseomonas populi]|uniref:DUF6894 domain-containing protein n=1 Tax=Roseomonas populi TaxID=3121582 RepID=A0ABT1XA98_9PROT|nr:hypothetical protein [Roseomonas pecuniae]MCR0985030.1 hypothetical protein [Roseomonas pecuniae]